MICLDSSVLVDYLDGREHARAFFEEREDRPFFAPPLVFFELYRGAARAGGADAVERLASSLEWLDRLESTDASVREAALIEAELLERGRPINLGDVIVAGACRAAGATLVTCDRDFERVEGLDVEVLPRDGQ